MQATSLENDNGKGNRNMALSKCQTPLKTHMNKNIGKKSF